MSPFLLALNGAFAINLGVFFNGIAVVLVLHPSETLTPEVA
ncbi:MAG: hypothetical protein R3C09_01945 [Pirellulaceae bacterium]